MLHFSYGNNYFELDQNTVCMLNAQIALHSSQHAAAAAPAPVPAQVVLLDLCTGFWRRRILPRCSEESSCLVIHSLNILFSFSPDDLLDFLFAQFLSKRVSFLK